MSVALIGHAFKTKLNPRHKLVLLAICDYAKDDGECFPSISILAEKCSISNRQLFRYLKELEKYIFLNREARPGHSTIYKITDPEKWPTHDIYVTTDTGDTPDS